jgi:hypothetical protein
MSGDCRNHMKNYTLCGTHGNIIPNEYLSYKKLLLMRNPYDRVVSMWKWVCKIKERDFNTYFYNGADWPTCFPVTKNYPYDELIKVENLFEDFKKLDIEIDPDEFPRMNYVDDLNHDLTALEKEIIFWFHKSDFEAGNYKK